MSEGLSDSAGGIRSGSKKIPMSSRDTTPRMEEPQAVNWVTGAVAEEALPLDRDGEHDVALDIDVARDRNRAEDHSDSPCATSHSAAGPLGALSSGVPPMQPLTRTPSGSTPTVVSLRDVTLSLTRGAVTAADSDTGARARPGRLAGGSLSDVGPRASLTRPASHLASLSEVGINPKSSAKLGATACDVNRDKEGELINSLVLSSPRAASPQGPSCAELELQPAQADDDDERAATSEPQLVASEEVYSLARTLSAPAAESAAPPAAEA